MGYADGTQLRWHAHDWHQLVYAISGVLIVETAIGSWIVPPDRAVWLPANTTHRLTARGRIQLRTVYVNLRLRSATAISPGVVEVSALLRELILDIVRRETLNASSTAEARLARVLVDLLTTVDVAPLVLPMPDDQDTTEFARRLREQPGADLDAVARDLGMNRRTVERRFKEQTGMSLGRWRERLRLVAAIELLATGSSVTDAGLTVGYSTTSAFVTAFRRQLGTTPGRYFTATPR